MESADASAAELPWDSEALDEMQQAPRHLHEMIRAMCEEHARGLGKPRVDMEVIRVLKGDRGGGRHGSGNAAGGAMNRNRQGAPGGIVAKRSGHSATGTDAHAGNNAGSLESASADVDTANTGADNTTNGSEPSNRVAAYHSQANEVEPLGDSLDPFLDLYAQEGVDALTEAFTHRSPPHISLPAVRVPAEQLQQTWQEALRDELPQQRRRSLYLHVPFCRQRCSYCPFYLMSYREDDAAAYVDLLLRDIELTASQIPAFDADSGGEYQAIFFGGGTPSDLSGEQLARLLRALRRHFPLSRDCEITVEGRVVGFEADKAQACRDAGATRISLGVQCFDTKVRQGVGRIANEAEVCRAMEALGAIDGLALNIDLIYGLPGQNMDIWQRDLERVNALGGIRGVDIYELKKIPGSPLARAQSMGRVPRGEGLAQRAQMYAMGAQMLESAGWERLSCCHWGRDGNRQNRYNVYAKSGASCLPFGCCSGGRIGLLTMGGPQDVKDYRKMLDRGEKPLASARRVSDFALLHDRIAGQLEFGRLDPESVQPGLRAYLLPLLEQWTRSGLLEQGRGAGWGLTLAGRFWIKEISSRLALALR